MTLLARFGLHAYDTEGEARRATRRDCCRRAFSSKRVPLDALVKVVNYACSRCHVHRRDQLANPHLSGSFTSDQKRVLNLCAYKKLAGKLARAETFHGS